MDTRFFLWNEEKNESPDNPVGLFSEIKIMFKKGILLYFCQPVNKIMIITKILYY